MKGSRTATADPETIEALHEAPEDKYKARATYRKVIDTFGPVRPFVNIVEAEERHARALLGQFARLGVEPPVPYSGEIGLPADELRQIASRDDENVVEALRRTVPVPAGTTILSASAIQLMLLCTWREIGRRI